jgi:hypothetical protein
MFGARRLKSMPTVYPFLGKLRRKNMTTTHLSHLKQEVEILKSKIQEHDTGHIITAIQVLEERIREEEKFVEEILDSTYPDGVNYWKTEF